MLKREISSLLVDYLLEGKKEKLVLGFEDAKKVLELLEFEIEVDLKMEIKGCKVEVSLAETEIESIERERKKVEEKRLNKAIELINKEGRIWFDSAGVEIEVEKNYIKNTYNIREGMEINYGINLESLKQVLGLYIDFLEIDKLQHPNLSL